MRGLFAILLLSLGGDCLASEFSVLGGLNLYSPIYRSDSGNGRIPPLPAIGGGLLVTQTTLWFLQIEGGGFLQERRFAYRVAGSADRTEIGMTAGILAAGARLRFFRGFSVGGGGFASAGVRSVQASTSPAAALTYEEAGLNRFDLGWYADARLYLNVSRATDFLINARYLQGTRAIWKESPGITAKSAELQVHTGLGFRF